MQLHPRTITRPSDGADASSRRRTLTGVGTKTLQEIAREVAREWVADGHLHAPPDSTGEDGDAAFFAEIDRRYDAQASDATPDNSRP